MAFDIELTGRFLADGGQRAGFLLLAAFLLSFLFIRTSTRLIRDPRVTWWPGNVETKGGLHIHHMVWGILLLLVSGFLAFALQPASLGYEVLAVLFGIGAGPGPTRAGLASFDTGDGSSTTAIGSIVAINLGFVMLAVLKGRRLDRGCLRAARGDRRRRPARRPRLALGPPTLSRGRSQARAGAGACWTS